MFDTAEMLKIFQRHRGDAVVVPGRGGRHWTDISTQPRRDVPLGDPAMGGHASFAFGLALARPDQKVVVFDSEGDLMMSLGVLATIAELQPKNFYHFMLDNECYATTGGQPVPNARNVAYDAIARGAGYARAYAYDNLEKFALNIERILAEPGPVFVAMKVAPEVQNEPIGKRKRWLTRSRDQVVKDLQQELGITGK
jgi:phosphonopyruvate decarboxylase